VGFALAGEQRAGAGEKTTMRSGHNVKSRVIKNYIIHKSSRKRCCLPQRRFH